MNFASIFLLAAISTNLSEPVDYSTAYENATKGNKPLLVLVTADWCPPCRTMKNSVLPELIRKNSFNDYYFATVDFDQEKELAQKLVQNRGIPQLLLYEKNEEGNWKLNYLSGAQSVEVVETFLSNSQTRRTARSESDSKVGH